MDRDRTQRGRSPFRWRPPFDKQNPNPEEAKSSPATCLLYTAGQCDHERGPGGWAYVVLIDGIEQEENGEELNTTALQIELIAAIKGLAATPTGSSVQVFTNSQSVQHFMRRQRAPQRAGEQTQRDQGDADHNLWRQLEALAAERYVEWEWMKISMTKTRSNFHHLRVHQLAGAARRRAAARAARGDEDTNHGSTEPPPGDKGTEPPRQTGQGPQEHVESIPEKLELEVAQTQPLSTADEEPLPMIDRERHMSTDDGERHVSTDDRDGPYTSTVESTVWTADTSASDASAPRTLSREEQRRALLDECNALEQRWVAVCEQVADLDAEWQRLLEPLRSEREAPQEAHSLDWVSGAVLFHDLDQHAARLSGLTAEALQACNQYAGALQRAMRGLDV